MPAVLAQAADAAQATGGSAEFWVFWVMAPIGLGSAIAMVLMRNAVHSALMLVANFFTIAVFYAVLEAQFLAVVQIIVYAGAIMVLFLFVLMLMGVGGEQVFSGRIRGQMFAALALGVVLFGALTVAVAGPYLGADAACNTAAQGSRCVGLAGANAEGNVRAIGFLVFTKYVWPFEVTSVLLVIAALGAMVLGRRSERAEDLVDHPVEAASPEAPAERGGDA